MSVNLNLNNPPTTLDEAINRLYDGLEKKEIEFIQSETNSVVVHHGFGTWLRNNLHLWVKTTPIVIWFNQNFGLGHADDISGIILEGLWCKVNNIMFEPYKTVERYKKHWIGLRVSPLDQSPLNK